MEKIPCLAAAIALLRRFVLPALVNHPGKIREKKHQPKIISLQPGEARKTGLGSFEFVFLRGETR